MRLPSALTAPVSALTPRQRRIFFWLTTAALVLILLWAAQARALWPRWPIADPDTWGYLHPALSKLLGGAFEHTYGRNFVYPGFLYLILRATADFGAITFVQHTLGLASGVLLWTAWRQWREWFTAASRLPAWADAALGLSLVAFYLRSASVIHFEMQIRPEGVFPVFAIAQLCLLLAFARAWWGEVRRPDRAAVFAGANLLAAALVYQLKPSYGLAFGVAALPIAWAVIFPWRRQDWRPRLRLVGASVAAVLAAGVVFVLPEHEFAQVDPNTQLFLPETLLTVHAGVIRDTMLADQRASFRPPFAPEWFAAACSTLDREMGRASEPAARPYESLGFNPDHLMYNGESFCRWLFDTTTRQQIVTFCFYYYERAWTHHPGAMLANVGRQLGVFYTWHSPAFLSTQKLKIERFYNKTNDAFGVRQYQKQMLSYAPAASYLDAADHLAASTDAIRFSPRINFLNDTAAECFLVSLLLFLAGMIAVRFLPPDRRRELWLPGGVLLLLAGVLFGNCLTVAVVHSFDIERYSYNLLIYVVLCETAAAAWLYELAWAFRASGTDPAPQASAPAATIPFHPETLPSP